YFFFQAEDGIRDRNVTGVQTCALPISSSTDGRRSRDTRAPLRRGGCPSAGRESAARAAGPRGPAARARVRRRRPLRRMEVAAACPPLAPGESEFNARPETHVSGRRQTRA